MCPAYRCHSQYSKSKHIKARSLQAELGAGGTRGTAARHSTGPPGPARQAAAVALPEDSARSPPPPPPPSSGARRGAGEAAGGVRGPGRGKGRGHGAVTWARAVARGVRSPAAAGPRTHRARSFPRRPGELLGPRPEASRPGRPSSAPRRCPRGPDRLELRGRPAAGGLSRWAPGSPHPLPPPGRPRSLGESRKGLPRRAGGRERRLRHPNRSVTAAATTTRAVLLLPTCREATEHARAGTTSGSLVPVMKFTAELEFELSAHRVWRGAICNPNSSTLKPGPGRAC
ncbi:proline-rich proteoglycan 2-like [Gorilla gorilla gorilla]|uniref:proline-rich proteoglycan 2-like n=1 Tax=Gorilla gorilla gorilla TaxID=9595 RepID=UPI002445E3A2|nr:proline-rich proteoglycan 2-like [Gorilla gorilla gorilla]